MRARRRVWVIVAAAVCGLMFAGYLDGARPSTASKPPRKTATVKPPTPTWIVIEVMDWKGDISYEVIQPKGLPDRITRAHKDYLKAVENWKKDKLLADINKTKFEEKKPVRGYVKRVETTPPSFRYQELAAAQAVQVAKQRREGKPPVTTPEPSKTVDPSKPHEPPQGEVVKPTATDDTTTERP